MFQARKLAAKLRYEKKRKWAAGVIRKCYDGWKVRQEYRRKFRAVAGPKVVRYIQRALVSINVLLT